MMYVWEAPTFINWSIWFGTASIGYLMVLPLMISWLAPFPKTYNRRNIIEIILIFAFCFISSLLIFAVERDKPFVYPYLIFPVLLLSALRFELRVTSIAFQIFIIIASICSANALGPFAMGEYYREIVLVRFNLFCGITIITVLVVSALHAEREFLVHELQDALSQIKTLSGFIPICSHCKKIRDDSGYWNKLETYIQENSDAQLSHGICPDCAKKHYPDYFDSNDDKKSILS